MPSNALGYSFAPTFENAQMEPRRGAGNLPQGAIQTLNYRLPRVTSGAISPLVSDQPAKTGFSSAVIESVLRTILGPEAFALGTSGLPQNEMVGALNQPGQGGGFNEILGALGQPERSGQGRKSFTTTAASLPMTPSIRPGEGPDQGLGGAPSLSPPPAMRVPDFSRPNLPRFEIPNFLDPAQFAGMHMPQF